MAGSPVRISALAPLAVVLAVAGADLLGGRGFIVLGLVVVAPLLAAVLNGPGLTAVYAVLTLVVAALLGVWDEVYTTDSGGGAAAQAVRLVGVALGGGLAVWASAQRVQRERRLVSLTRVAEVAQRTILSAEPAALPGLDVAVAYQSAATDALVGGDLYEVTPSPWGPRLLVGDVRGKGLDAVRLAARVLGAFRALAPRTADLAELMAALDAEVAAARASDEDFVTAVLVQVDADGRVTVLNAGHPDPLLVTGHDVVPLTPPGRHLPLGLGTRPVAYRCPFPSDGRMLLHTDGLAEARRARTREFLPYLDTVRDTLGTGTVAEGLAALLAELDAWTGRELGDDVALLAVARSVAPAVTGAVTDGETIEPAVHRPTRAWRGARGRPYGRRHGSPRP